MESQSSGCASDSNGGSFRAVALSYLLRALIVYTCCRILMDADSLADLMGGWWGLAVDLAIPLIGLIGSFALALAMIPILASLVRDCRSRLKTGRWSRSVWGVQKHWLLELAPWGVVWLVAFLLGKFCFNAKEDAYGVTWRYKIADGGAVVCHDRRGLCLRRPAISVLTEGGLRFPSTLGGRPLNAIGDYAFYNCSRLTSAAIPDGVAWIGRGAFSGCESLASVAIPNGVKSIGSAAFADCGVRKVYVEKGDSGRVREMMRGTGMDVDRVEFLEPPAVCSREEGMVFLRMAEVCSADGFKRDDSWRVKTYNDGTRRYEFFYPLEGESLRRAVVCCDNGEMRTYEYYGGILDSSVSENTNSTSSSGSQNMVRTIYIGDGKSTNCVDRMEFDIVDGEVKETWLLDANGKRINWVKPRDSFLDIGYAPGLGARTKIGPYEWTIVARRCQGVLSCNGKKVLQGSLLIGGKYPWIVGLSTDRLNTAARAELVDSGIVSCDSDGCVGYLFVLDVRNNHVEYYQEDRKDVVKAITGCDYFSYRNKSDFWGFGLSRSGSKRIAKLEAALRPPAEVEPSKER